MKKRMENLYLSRIFEEKKSSCSCSQTDLNPKKAILLLFYILLFPMFSCGPQVKA